MKIAWCSYFPVECISAAPDIIRRLTSEHPAPWLLSGVEELKKLPELKLHVIHVCKGLQRDVLFEVNGVTFHCLKVPGGWRAPSLFWLDTFLIRRRLKQVQPDVLHAWGTEKGAALVASRLSYPYLVSLQGVLEYYGQLTALSRYEHFAARLERISLRRASVASGESALVVKWLRQHFPHLQVHHVEHAPDAMFHRVIRQPQTKPVEFLCVGAFSHRKGTDHLILALDKLLPELDFRLTMIGLSPQAEFLESMKHQTSPELWSRVNVLSRQTSADIAAHLAKATMVLFPTRADTGPVAVKEAAVAGVPVLGSVMGGIPDYITSGKNGLLFPPGDLAAFVQAIREACAHPLFSRGLVDETTLRRVRQHLSPRRMAEGFLQIYRQLQSTKKGTA